MLMHLLYKLHSLNKYKLRFYLLQQKKVDSLLELVLMELDLYNIDSRAFVKVNHLLLSVSYLKWHAMLW